MVGRDEQRLHSTISFNWDHLGKGKDRLNQLLCLMCPTVHHVHRVQVSTDLPGPARGDLLRFPLALVAAPHCRGEGGGHP